MADFNIIDFGRIGKPSILINMGYRPMPPPPPRRWSYEKCLDAARDSNHLEQLLEKHKPTEMIQPVRPWSNAEICTACAGIGLVPTSIVDGTEDMRECSLCFGKGVIYAHKDSR